MTSPYVTPPPAERPAAWRVVLVVLACLAGPPAAAAAAFLAVVVWSGCFIECSVRDGNPAGGFGLGLLALVLLLLGPALAWLLLRTWRSVVAATGGVVVTLLGFGLLLGMG